MGHRPLDPTPEAARIQAAAQAELGPAGRLAVALDLWTGISTDSAT